MTVSYNHRSRTGHDIALDRFEEEGESRESWFFRSLLCPSMFIMFMALHISSSRPVVSSVAETIIDREKNKAVKKKKKRKGKPETRNTDGQGIYIYQRLQSQGHVKTWPAYRCSKFYACCLLSCQKRIQHWIQCCLCRPTMTLHQGQIHPNEHLSI